MRFANLRFVLLLTTLLATACSRTTGDLYRAYNVLSPAHLKQEDLATQNRNSLQTTGSYAYLYTLPEAAPVTKKADAPADSQTQAKEQTEEQAEALADTPPAQSETGQKVPARPTAPSPAQSAEAALKPSAPALTLQTFALEDLKGKSLTFAFPTAKAIVFAFADQDGASQLEPWIKPLYDRYGDKIEIHGVAMLSNVPAFARGIARSVIAALGNYPILLDWQGDVSKRLGVQPKQANLFIVNQQGEVVASQTGKASLEKLKVLAQKLDQLTAK